MVLRKSLLFGAIIAVIGFMSCPTVHTTGKTTLKRHRHDSCTVVISKTIDLSDLDLTDPATPKTFSVSAIFGKALVIVNPKMRLRITVNASWCSSVTLPDGARISSSDDGYAVYEANLEDDNGNKLKPEFYLSATATFGSVVIVNAE